MSEKENHLDIEELFHKHEKKLHRKERNIAKKKDRSKFKKTDMEKQTPTNLSSENSLTGRILTVSSEGIFVDYHGREFICSIKGSLKHIKGRDKNLVIVGDVVDFNPINDSTGSIVHVHERYSFLSRAENYNRKKQQLIAANIDQVFITCSTFLPIFKHTLVDRYVVMAQKGNMKPIIIINKSDYLKEKPSIIEEKQYEQILEMISEFIEAYKKLSIPVILSSTHTNEGIEEIKTLMQNKTSVFSGQSGVGKTSLINKALNLNLRTSDIKYKTRKGKHTTTTSSLIALENGGYCVDTPGIKSFGLWDIELSELLYFFPDIQKYSHECKFPNCTHIHEPDCSVKEALDDQKISYLRYSSYIALYEDIKHKHQLF